MKKIIALIFCLVLVLGGITFIGLGAGVSGNVVYGYSDKYIKEILQHKYVADELIIGFNDIAEFPKKEKQYRDEVTKIKKLAFTEITEKVFVIKAEDLQKNPIAVINRFKNSQFVDYVEPNYIAEAFAAPNDPSYGTQSAVLTVINAQSGWDIRTSGGPPVAIIDSGIIANHPDLPTLLPGYSAVTSLGPNSDTNGHGTGVAGTVGMRGNNGIGGTGVNWNAQLIPVKIDDASGTITVANVAKGVVWSADNAAKVLNMSLGTASDGATLKNAINYAYGKGCVMFAATGNSGADPDPAKRTVSYPARYDNVIGVGSTTNGTARVSSSSYGPGINVVAVGSYYTTTRTGSYTTMQGTSFATPMVAGLASLVLAEFPTATQQQVYNIIQDNAKKIGAYAYDSNGWHQEVGYGLIDMGASLAAARALAGGAQQTVDSVAISPNTASVAQGETRSFAATVTGTNNPPQGVTWSITGNSSANTTITQGGMLTIAANESTSSIITVKATSTFDTAKSATATVSVLAALVKETTPSASINYSNETLTGLVSNGTYKFNGSSEITTITGTTHPIQSSWFGQTISVVKAGNNTTTTDSDPQSLAVPNRPAAPNVTGIRPTAIANIDGKITGVTDAMEYQRNSSPSMGWTACPNGEITGLIPGTYQVRVAAASTLFSGFITPITISEYGLTPEVRPNPSINFVNETLTSLAAGEYTFNGSPITVTGTTQSIKDFISSVQVQLTIIKLGNGITTSNSDSRTVTLPQRRAAPATPTERAVTKTSIQITTVNNAEYSIDYFPGKENATWENGNNLTFSGLESGALYKIYARYRANSPANNFASVITEIPLQSSTLLAAKITTTSLPDWIVGTPYYQTLQADGTGTITWTRASGTLPTGINLSASGVLSGTPTSPGSYTFTIRARNNNSNPNNGDTDDKQFTITISTTEPIVADKETYDMSEITFESKTVIYNGQPHSLAIAGNLPAGVSVSYEDNDKINADQYTVTANFTGDTEIYNLIPSMSAILEIRKAEPTFTQAGVYSYTYGETLESKNLSDESANISGTFQWINGEIAPMIDTTLAFIRFIPDDTGNYETIEFALTITVQKASQAAPEAIISFSTEQVTGLADGEEYLVSFSGQASQIFYGPTFNIPSSWGGSTAGQITIIKVGNATTADSSQQTLTIPARPGIPAVTTDKKEKISGVTTAMEYRQIAPITTAWITCPDGEITGLTAGTYEVRYKATTTSFNSLSVALDIFDDEENNDDGLSLSNKFYISGSIVLVTGLLSAGMICTIMIGRKKRAVLGIAKSQDI